MSIWDIPSRIWSFTRKIEDLMKLQAQTRDAIQSVEDRLRVLEDRMMFLEANQGQLVTEAKSVASAAATGLAGSVVAELSTRVTRIEVRHDELLGRLPPPG